MSTITQMARPRLLCMTLMFCLSKYRPYYGRPLYIFGSFDDYASDFPAEMLFSRCIICEHRHNFDEVEVLRNKRLQQFNASTHGDRLAYMRVIHDLPYLKEYDNMYVCLYVCMYALMYVCNV